MEVSILHLKYFSELNTIKRGLLIRLNKWNLRWMTLNLFKGQDYLSKCMSTMYSTCRSQKGFCFIVDSDLFLAKGRAGWSETKIMPHYLANLLSDGTPGCI